MKMWMQFNVMPRMSQRIPQIVALCNKVKKKRAGKYWDVQLTLNIEWVDKLLEIGLQKISCIENLNDATLKYRRQAV